MGKLPQPSPFCLCTAGLQKKAFSQEVRLLAFGGALAFVLLEKLSVTLGKGIIRYLIPKWLSFP
jgi:hypothetical protein